MRLFLALSYPNGWGGVAKLVGAIHTAGLKLYGALASGDAYNGMSCKQLAEAYPLMEQSERGLRLHLAERDPQHHGWATRGAEQHGLRLRILLSYHYYRDTDLNDLFQRYFSPPYPEVFVDSGAYSAKTQGAVIDLDAYAAYIQRYRHLITTYANLDVIGDAEATWRNQQHLEALGLHPLPVFHAGEPWSYLERYIERYPYIALGGLVGKIGRAKAWLVRCFKLARGHSVYHGFGVTTWDVLKAFPWYSVDSSSWGQGFRFGQMAVFDPQRGRFIKLDLGDAVAWRKHAPLIRTLGFDPADFAHRARNDRAKICALSAVSYLHAERWLRRWHGEISIPTQNDRSAGPLTYLADANPARYSDAISGASGVRLHLADTSNGINYADADRGLKLHLAEHSLDRGGVGDTSRALDVLSGKVTT